MPAVADGSTSFSNFSLSSSGDCSASLRGGRFRSPLGISHNTDVSRTTRRSARMSPWAKSVFERRCSLLTAHQIHHGEGCFVEEQLLLATGRRASHMRSHMREKFCWRHPQECNFAKASKPQPPMVIGDQRIKEMIRDSHQAILSFEHRRVKITRSTSARSARIRIPQPQPLQAARRLDVHNSAPCP